MVLILTGKAIPTDDRSRTVIYEKGSIICSQMNVVEVLPSLLAKEVITERDCEKIQAKNKNEGNWEAALSLLFRLPNKQVAWFSKFIEALEESKHRDLAEKLKTSKLFISLYCVFSHLSLLTYNKSAADHFENISQKYRKSI